jgi:hypothetical protein
MSAMTAIHGDSDRPMSAMTAIHGDSDRPMSAMVTNATVIG